MTFEEAWKQVESLIPPDLHLVISRGTHAQGEVGQPLPADPAFTKAPGCRAMVTKPFSGELVETAWGLTPTEALVTLLTILTLEPLAGTSGNPPF